MNCTNCDAPLPPGATFCANCGTRVTQATSAGAPTIAIPAVQNEQAGTVDLQPADTQRPASAQPYAPQPYTPPSPQSYTSLPQPYTPPQPSYMPVSQPTSNAATVSLIFGILSWVILPLIGAIIAVIAGHMARREIRDSGGQLGGSGMATAGLVLGYIQIGLSVLACIGFVLLLVIGAAASR